MLLCSATATEGSSSTATATGATPDAALIFIVAHLLVPTDPSRQCARTNCILFLLPNQTYIHLSKEGVLAAVRSAQMMALMERSLDLLDVVGHGPGQLLGHAAAAAEGAAASSDLSEPLGSPVPAGDVDYRSQDFSAAVKGNLGNCCMITGVILRIIWHSCLSSDHWW